MCLSDKRHICKSGLRAVQIFFFFNVPNATPSPGQIPCLETVSALHGSQMHASVTAVLLTTRFRPRPTRRQVHTLPLRLQVTRSVTDHVTTESLPSASAAGRSRWRQGVWPPCLPAINPCDVLHKRKIESGTRSTKRMFSKEKG